MSRDGGLERIGPSLDAFLEQIGMPTALDLATLVDSWDEVAGEAIAGVARPVGLRDGELVVGVDNGRSASLLKYRLGSLLDRLQARFGTESVRQIRIRVVDDEKGR